MSAEQVGQVTAARRQPKPWGHELIFAVVPGKYVGKILHLNAGHSMSLQFHRQKEETIHLLSGQAVVQYGVDDEELVEEVMAPGDTIHLRPGVRHRLVARPDAQFVEASTAAEGWHEDIVRLEDRYGRAGSQAP